jgi:hypothetical protein
VGVAAGELDGLIDGPAEGLPLGTAEGAPEAPPVALVVGERVCATLLGAAVGEAPQPVSIAAARIVEIQGRARDVPFKAPSNWAAGRRGRRGRCPGHRLAP